MYCAWRIPAHLRCTQCSILLHLMDICFLTCICLWQISQIQTCRTWISLDITRFCEQQRQPSSGSACPKNGKSGPHCWGRGGSTQFAQQLETTVTATPLVGCVVWSRHQAMSTFIHCSVVGVVPLYPQIGKIIWSAPVSCVLDHHDVNVILHNGRLYSRSLGNGSLCVPMYQLDVVCSTC